jgi:flagellin
MSVVINTNSAATSAAYNLSNTNVNLQRSLNRLSSGSRINSSYDDAGGLAVSMKLSASIRRTDATLANVNNSVAFLQTQDGVLKTADKVLSRMSELATLAQDVTKTTTDLSLYNTELDQLKGQLRLMVGEKFNGINLFSSGATAGLDSSSTMTVVTSHDGVQTVGITQADLDYVSTSVGSSSTTGMHIDTFAGATAAWPRSRQRSRIWPRSEANNGAEQSRLSLCGRHAGGEQNQPRGGQQPNPGCWMWPTRARSWRDSYILQQAGTAMLAQANQSSQSILRLIS